MLKRRLLAKVMLLPGMENFCSVFSLFLCLFEMGLSWWRQVNVMNKGRRSTLKTECKQETEEKENSKRDCKNKDEVKK